MARYTGPKVRLSRRVGVPIADIPKHTSKELQLSGQHGYRGRRSTEYGIRLIEKQKLRYHYGMLEKQFRRTLDEARRVKGNTATVFIQLLERRLDNVVRRIGISRTIWASRQMVNHGHILVNGKKVDIPSFVVEPGMEITVKEKAKPLAREMMDTLAGHEVPAWITFNPNQLVANVQALPSPEDVPFEVNMNLIIEFYR